MKRPAKPDLAAETPSPRRRRALSEEERALWESVARQAKPLRKPWLRRNHSPRQGWRKP
jgi:hypothetical protein